MRHRLYVAPDGEVVGHLGSSKIRRADVCVAHLLTAAEADRAVRARANGSAPPEGRVVPLAPQGLAYLRDVPDAALDLYRYATSFRDFLDVWTFRPEGSPPRLLGSNMWAAQERYVEAAVAHAWLFLLKARQLGASELECAFDGWRLRFGPQASRIHLLSLRESEACELMEVVRFGLDRLPEWLRLPATRETNTTAVYQASPDDRRVLRAYPASRTASRSATCTHLHLDEWAAMETDAERVYQSVEPTVAPDGTFHIVTTALAPEDAVSTYFRKCEVGEGAHVTIFAGALERPDRTPEWLEQKRRSMPKSRFMREYPLSADEALAAGGDRFFEDDDLDEATMDSLGLQPRQPNRRYLVSVDVGRQRDATVVLVLDVTPDDEMIDVVAGHRLVGVPFPQQQALIQRVANEYKANVVIEANGPGVALAENLALPEHRVHQFSTTGRSKPVALEKLYLALRGQVVKWAPELAWLTQEMRGYSIPDTNIRQDAVLALAIGVASADDPSITRRGGRVLPVIAL